MNRKSDPRMSFDPEPALMSQPALAPRRWLPVQRFEAAALDVRHWATRASRGYSWHRAGRVTH
jgi:hypothetical protein